MRRDPTMFQTLFGWARMEETDRNFARAEASRRGGAPEPRQPQHDPGARDAKRRRRRYEVAPAPRDEMEATRGRRPWAGRVEREGPPTRPDGPRRRGVRGLHRGQTDAASATGLELRAEDAAALGGAARPPFSSRREAAKSCRAPPSAPTWPSRSSSSAFPAQARPWSSDAERASEDHAGDELPTIDELTDSSRAFSTARWPTRRRSPNSGLATRPRRSTTSATTTCSAPASSARSARAPLVHRQDAAERDASRPIGADLPEAPIIHLIRHPLDVVLLVFSNHLTHGFYCAYDLTETSPATTCW